MNAFAHTAGVGGSNDCCSMQFSLPPLLSYTWCLSIDVRYAWSMAAAATLKAKVLINRRNYEVSNANTKPTSYEVINER